MPAELDRRRLDTVQVVPPTPFSNDGRSIAAELLTRLVRDLVDAFLDAGLVDTRRA